MPIDCLSLALNSFLFLFMLSIKAFSWVYLQTQTALSQQLMRYKVFISQVTIDGESEGVPLCRWCLKKSIYEVQKLSGAILLTLHQQLPVCHLLYSSLWDRC